MNRTTHIWGFEVVATGIRLVVEVDDDQQEVLRAALAEVSYQSADLDSFMRESSHLISSHGGILGELMKGSRPVKPLFRAQLRSAMDEKGIYDAVEVLLRAAKSADRDEARMFLYDVEWQKERSYVFGIWYGLDEAGNEFASSFADSLEIPKEQLLYMIGALSD